MWCIQTIDSEFRKRMYDVLDLYEEDYDPKRPLICLDEKPKQLLEDKKTPIPIKPGSPEKLIKNMSEREQQTYFWR